MSTDTPVSDLEALVRRTAGSQPWRKLFHAGNGVAIAIGLNQLELSRTAALVILAAILAVVIAVDVVRLGNPALNRLFFRWFAPLASPREARGIASSTWYTLGVLVCVAIASREIATSAILVLGLADPAASYTGRRWGVAPFMGGTVLGTLTFFGVALIVLATRHSLPVALVAAAVVTFAERRSWPLDDNLTIPVVGAAILSILERGI